MSTLSRDHKAARFGAAAFGLIALACAAIAAMMVSQWLKTSGAAPQERVFLVVALRDIASGEAIPKEALKVVEWPGEVVPREAFSNLEALYASGKPPIAATGIIAGEPILSARLASSAQGTAMAALVQTGYRAIPVKVDNAVTRAGLLYPGARVDVLATLKSTTTYAPTTRVVVGDVRVLSVEARTDIETYRPAARPDNEAPVDTKPDAVVTIEVTPEQSEVVLLAQREGKIDLSLRNALDRELAKTSGATPTSFIADRLVKAESNPAAAAAAALERPKGRRRNPRAKPSAEVETYVAQ